jgi:multiple sugar transport system substrate-binding protein
MRTVLGIATGVLLAFGLAACGGGEDDGRGANLNLWVFQEPSGSFTDAAKRCSDASNGRYTITFNALSNAADAQRQALVRRLAAHDSSIDIAGLDVVWTAEFAEADWIKAWPEDLAAEIRQGTLKGPLATATYENKLYAAPANTNTQLLWYRKDLVKTPPKTWDEMIDMASKMPKAGRIEIQGAQYEGVVVWFNALVTGAGGTILKGSSGDQVALGPPADRAAAVMKKLADSPAADPSLSAQREDQNRIAFESGDAAFQVNYPFIYPSAKEGNPEVFKQIAWTIYPRTDADKPARPPVGGINWGVGGYTKHPQEAFEAAACLRNEENQRQAAVKGGLPPTLSALYDDPSFKKDYPFAEEIRDSVNNGGVRPVTPAYADVSLAIAKTVSPPSEIEVEGFSSELKSKIESAINSEALL